RDLHPRVRRQRHLCIRDSSDAINLALQQPQRTDYDLSRYSPTSIIAETAGVYSSLLAES
ncbi:MAG: hypothetical protein K2H39_06765, partial [Paramuribaculum sp.]|nr:hypothetical protein [Paramuribaculum sp.]